MNISSASARPFSLRSVSAIAAGLALTLAACGGDDAAESTTTPAPAADEIPTQPAAIVFEDQESDGSTITIASVELPAPGFVAVHSDGGGSPGPVIGTSELLSAGTSSKLGVQLTEPLGADSVLFPMVHIDTNGNGLYEFGTVEGVDGPGVTAGGDVAVVGAMVTVATGGADPDTSDGGAAPAGDNAITIANFSFDGVTEVAVGDTIVINNTDSTPHTWTAEDRTFDSGAIGGGESFEFTFTEAGQFSYFCNFHASMTGTIVVTG